MAAKIPFFQSFTSIIKPYLKIFQSDKPLTPFLYQLLMQKFMKKVLDENKSIQKPMKLD